MVDRVVSIVANRQISPDFYQLDFHWKSEWGVPAPGQFLELRVTEATAPLLRRPLAFSGYDTESETASLIYQLRGQSTQLLSLKKEQQEVKILAPLGNAFGLEGRPEKVIAVAGGVGLGPILFAAKEMSEAGSDVTFVTGFRNHALVPERSLWDGLNATLCTDDGSEGFNGNVVQYLETLSDKELKGARIIACGPTPMLKALHNFTQKKGLVCEVSMEEMMACGLGACVGCVIDTADGGLVRVCKDGPVFESELLKWD